MPIHKKWNPIGPRSISFVVDFYLENQQDIRADHDWDSDISHKWTLSTISQPIGVITLDPNLGTDMHPAGTLYGYQHHEDISNKESDYPPKLLQLVKNGASFIDYCDEQGILTEIDDMDIYSSLRDINGLIRTAYLSFDNIIKSK
ncbi:MAG TPA: hypothetical protein DGN60_02730 [Chloroflexi bacterium]|nr:hypothetical protein [Chloroflexota bacterium]